MLIDEGRIGREGGRWVARGDFSSLGVPATLHALIAARLDGLASNLRRAGDVLLRHDLPNLVYALTLGAAPTS